MTKKDTRNGKILEVHPTPGRAGPTPQLFLTRSISALQLFNGVLRNVASVLT